MNQSALMDYVFKGRDGNYIIDGIAEMRRIIVPIMCFPLALTGLVSPVAAQSSGEEFQDCDTCPKMVVVPAGSFMMGSPKGEKGRDDDEGPRHNVRIPKPFAVGKFEVTKAQFEVFVKDSGHDTGNKCWTHEDGKAKERSGRSWRNPAFSQGNDHPVSCVNWEDAMAYISWLSRMTGKGYRLLSEAEWEYAARAGTTTRYSFGNSEKTLCSYANGADQSTSVDWRNKSCSDGIDIKTAPAGRYKANGFGLHDMHGNLWEWVADCWSKNYSGAPSDGSPRTSGDCKQRVLRGGSWINEPEYLRSAQRLTDNAVSRGGYIGFRVARTLTH